MVFYVIVVFDYRTLRLYYKSGAYVLRLSEMKQFSFIKHLLLGD
jgi:hypothetical protein